MEFNFNVPPKITKEFILSNVNQETIIHHYTGLDPTSKKLFKSILRTDNHVTCSFYKSKSGIVYMHDFATGQHLTCFNIVMELLGCNYYEALETIAKDFNLIESDNKPKTYKKIESLSEKTPSLIQVQVQDFTPAELEWWEKFGITKKILKKYHVFSCKHVFINGKLSYSSNNGMIFGYYFGKDKNGLELWKIYFPLRKDMRFLNNVGTSKLQGYKQLPKEGKLLVITKSLKDVMCLHNFGIPAIAPCSETVFMSANKLNALKERFEHIVVLYDNDRPGMVNMAKIRREFPELDYFMIPKKLGAKDVSDLCKMVGRDKTLELIRNQLIYYRKWLNDIS